MKKIVTMMIVLCAVLCMGSSKGNAAEVNTFGQTEVRGEAVESAIQVNTEYSNSLSTRDEVQMYKFTLSEPGQVNVSFSHANLNDTENYWVIQIINEKEENCMKWRSTGINTNGVSTDVGLPAGNYYLQINASYKDEYPHNYSAELYKFRLNYAKSIYWEQESNDSYSTANVISLNTQYHGANQFNDDLDYYKFTIGSAGKVCINFLHENLYDSDEYWFIRIYDEKTNEIIKWVSKGIDVNINTADVGLPAGNYYVRINPAFKERYPHKKSFIKYSFQVNYTPSAYWEVEINNTYTEATNISLNVQYSGACQFSDDLDYYKFVLGQSGHIKLNFYHPNLVDDDTYWRIRVYNINTEEIKMFDVKGTDTGFDSGIFYLNQGTYFIKINSSETYPYEYSSETYQLSVSNAVVEETKTPTTVSAPKKAKITSVKNTSKKTVTVKWKKVSGANGYEVYRSTKKSSGYKKLKTINKNSTVKYKVKGNKKGKTYYFKVRAFKKQNGKKIYGAFSSPKKVKVRK